MTNAAFKIIKPPKEVEDTSSVIHSPFIPLDIYQGENIQAFVRINQKADPIEMRVWRLSPLGIELAPLNNIEILPSSLKLGESLDLDVVIRRQKCSFKGLIVSSNHRHKNMNLIGVRWYMDAPPIAKNGHERRANRRWLCGEEFLPTGIAPNPVRFGDFLHFRIKDLSKTGGRILTSLRNRFIIPGMELDTMMSFPMFGQAKVRMKIVDVRVQSENGKDNLSIGATFINPEASLISIIANYVIQFSPDSSMEEINSEAMLPKTLSDKVSYGYARSKEDYEEVLDLRLRAYSASGKVDPNKTAREMGDEFDTRSRILVAKYRGKTVASMRVMFHEPNDPYEHDRFVSIPDWFPRKDEVVEVTRFCIDPQWQGSDLIFGMMRQLFMVMAHAQRRYAVTSATKEMMENFYLKFGAKSADGYFQHGDLGSLDHQLFYFDISMVIKGQSVGPILWNLLLADVYEYLVSNDLYRQDPVTNLRILFYRLFAPFARMLKSKLMTPRKRIKG
jgi:hypothetical protein